MSIAPIFSTYFLLLHTRVPASPLLAWGCRISNRSFKISIQIKTCLDRGSLFLHSAYRRARTSRTSQHSDARRLRGGGEWQGYLLCFFAGELCEWEGWFIPSMYENLAFPKHPNFPNIPNFSPYLAPPLEIGQWRIPFWAGIASAQGWVHAAHILSAFFSHICVRSNLPPFPGIYPHFPHCFTFLHIFPPRSIAFFFSSESYSLRILPHFSAWFHIIDVFFTFCRLFWNGLAYFSLLQPWNNRIFPFSSGILWIKKMTAQFSFCSCSKFLSDIRMNALFDCVETLFFQENCARYLGHLIWQFPQNYFYLGERSRICFPFFNPKMALVAFSLVFFSSLEFFGVFWP